MSERNCARTAEDRRAARVTRVRERASQTFRRSVNGLVFLIAVTYASTPALAQANTTNATNIGSVYCGTGVETGIGLVFTAFLGIGLPATIFYAGTSGLSYMRAGGDIERKRAAREKLVLSGIGFSILVLAIIAPGLISKIGEQIGFSFSDCVVPF